MAVQKKVDTIYTYKPFGFTWLRFKADFWCHDILMLGKSPIKRPRQRPDMTIVVDRDVKHQTN